MASAAAEEVSSLHRGLPDEIVVWEILVRLPPKAILRCSAVCSAWRRATSMRDFLLSHHARQPTFPLLQASEYGHYEMYMDIIPFDHRAGLTAADRRRSIARLDHAIFQIEASCDGLLVLSIGATDFAICNPATRQYAPLPLLHGFMVVGMYPCPGEYRLLLKPDFMYEGPDALYEYCHVFTLGSGQPPRHIGCPYAKRLEDNIACVLLHGNLHRYKGNMIAVFDTTVESFRQMHSPVGSSNDAQLFEIGGMLGISCRNDGAAIMDIWVMQDYQGEVWTFKHRVELPLAELKVQVQKYYGKYWTVVVASWDGDLLLLVHFGKWVFQVDMDGKLVASFHHTALLLPSQHQLKQLLFNMPSFRH